MQDDDQETGYVLWPEVHRRYPVSRCTVDKREKRGLFPKRKRLSENLVGWLRKEFEEFLASLPDGGVPAPTKAITASLEARKHVRDQLKIREHRS